MANVPTSEAQDLEVAARVRGFLAVLRRYRAGAVDADGLTRYARELWPEDGVQGTPFPGNGAASVAFDSIWCPTDPELRMIDIDGYIRWLTAGTGNYPTRVCAVRVSAASLAARLDLATQRYIIDGLGWIERVEFCSPITGRQFAAESSMHPDFGSGADVRACAMTRGPAPVLDLLNTLGLDASDCILERDEPIRWHLWRQDDNGHRALVASYPALQKARDELARLESSAHKQMYWLEPANADERAPS